VVNFTILINLGWNDLWLDNFVPWHKAEVNPKLASHLSTAVKASGKPDPGLIRFFVPLCGKSVDLKFLYDRGFQVTTSDPKLSVSVVSLLVSSLFDQEINLLLFEF
jgi:hypothetical protein